MSGAGIDAAPIVAPQRPSLSATLTQGGVAALVLGGIALGIFIVIFTAMWAPYFLVGAEGQLFLYPLFLLVGVVVGALAVTSIVFAWVALARRAQPRWLLIAAVGIGAALAVGWLPVLWFGGWGLHL